MIHIIKSVISIVFVCVGIFGFLCVVSEADPWTPMSQILLFIKGIVLIAISAVVIGLIERSENRNDIVSR